MNEGISLTDFITSDLASWLAFGTAVVGLIVAYIAFRRPLSHFYGGDASINHVGNRQFDIQWKIGISTLGASFTVHPVQFLITTGGFGVGFFRIRALRLQYQALDDPSGRFIKAGEIVSFRYLVTIPQGADRAWGRIKIRLSDNSRKRYKFAVKGLRKYG